MTIKVILQVNDEQGSPDGSVRVIDFVRRDETLLILHCEYEGIPFVTTEEGFDIGGIPFRAFEHGMYDGVVLDDSWLMRDLEANRLLKYLQGTGEWWASDGDPLLISDFERGAGIDLVEERLLDEP